MSWIEWLMALSYAVTVVGFPLAIVVFVVEQRRERRNEEQALYQTLSDEYDNFLRLVLDNADLQLYHQSAAERPLTQEQLERQLLIFEILVSIFERSYILLHRKRMNRQNQRLWSSWEDYIRSWCRRDDFRVFLPGLLQGEDDEFSRHIRDIAAAEAALPRHDDASVGGVARTEPARPAAEVSAT